MLKKILLILLFLGILPVYSGEFEEAAKTQDKIFLYLYAKDCGYCVKFNHIYNLMTQKYNNKCKFLKINANTEYGSSLMRTMNASYVPYVAMLDNNKRIIRTMNPVCMLNYGCAMDAIDKFVK